MSDAIKTQILETFKTAALWGSSVATGMMALLAVASLLGYMIRKYTS